MWRGMLAEGESCMSDRVTKERVGFPYSRSHRTAMAVRDDNRLLSPASTTFYKALVIAGRRITGTAEGGARPCRAAWELTGVAVCAATAGALHERGACSEASPPFN
jgi:hypothetical protein